MSALTTKNQDYYFFKIWTELILPQRQDSQYDGVLYNCTENTADARHDESLNSIEVTRPRAGGIVSNKIEGG